MPEGDTIYRKAYVIRPVLEGQRIIRVYSREESCPFQSLQGQLVTSVESRGKHLLIHFESKHVLHTHMGMTGSWHVYPIREPWKKPKKRAAIVLETSTQTLVCFSPKTLELLTARQLRQHAHLRRLGPDILASKLDCTKIVKRLRVHNVTPVGEALLNQTIVCGIGNIYKSEVLFITQTNPFQKVQQITDDQLRFVIERAHQLMRRNLDGGTRRTRYKLDSLNLWVYGRSGEECLKCATKIEMRRQGDAGRSTYWCPSCQAKNKTRQDDKQD